MIKRTSVTQIAAVGCIALIAFCLSWMSLSAQETTPDAQATATPLPKPLPVLTLKQGNATLELFFDRIQQGQVGLMHLSGPGVAGARARFFNRVNEFFPVEDGGNGAPNSFYNLLAVSMEQTPRDYELSVSVRFEDGTTASISTQVKVIAGNFIRQEFNIPPDRAYLIDPQIERSEFARLDSIFSAVTPERLWADEPFETPIKSEFTSPFGAYRTLNSTVQTRHTGWDLRAAVGTPVMAAAPGKVAFAGLIDIRGNYVVIDHGYGIYSGYAHLSQTHVTRGQSVVQGQIIGVSGNTGRSNGPHLHWEIVVNGEWVDSVQFMRTWLP